MSNPITNLANGEFYRFLAKVIIQLIGPRVDFGNIYWKIVHELHREDFAFFIRLCFDKKYPWNYIKDTIERYYDTNEYYPFITYAELVELFPCVVMSDSNELESVCDSILKDNPKSIEDYRKGKVNSINHLKGQVMKLTKGKADVKMVTEILERKLKL